MADRALARGASHTEAPNRVQELSLILHGVAVSAGYGLLAVVAVIAVLRPEVLG